MLYFFFSYIFQNVDNLWDNIPARPSSPPYRIFVNVEKQLVHVQDRTGCLLIRQAPSGPHSYSGSVHLYRDGGFTREDLAGLLKGYQEAWSGVRGQDDFYRYDQLGDFVDLLRNGIHKVP